MLASPISGQVKKKNQTNQHIFSPKLVCSVELHNYMQS